MNNLLGPLLGHAGTRRGGWHVLGRRDNIHGVSQSTRETHDLDVPADIERDTAPALEAKGVGEAHDLGLEMQPGFALLGAQAGGDGSRGRGRDRGSGSSVGGGGD